MMNRKTNILLLCILSVLGTLSISARDISSQTHRQIITYTESDGNKVHLYRNPRRTIVLYNSLLELWLYCNGTAVGRVKGQQNLPESAHSIEVLGSVGHPNIERLVALNPDLVILSANMRNHRKIRVILKENQIPSVMVRYNNVEDFFKIARLFARLNQSETETENKLQTIKGKIESIRESCKPLKSPTVLILFSSANALSCELPTGDTGKLVKLLGGKNIAYTVKLNGVRRVDINLEFIVRQDPEIILIKTMGQVEKCQKRIRKEFSQNPAWNQIKAVRLNQVHILPKRLFLYKSNHNYPKSLLYLANLLYPNRSAGNKVAVSD